MAGEFVTRYRSQLDYLSYQRSSPRAGANVLVELVVDLDHYLSFATDV